MFLGRLPALVMHKKYIVELTDTERHDLDALTRRRSHNARVVRRAFMLLKADQAPGAPAWPDERIAESFGVGLRTVERLRQRFVDDGLDVVLHGKPREPAREKLFDGQVEAHLVALRCSAPPTGHARWTLRLLADQMVELGYVEAISHESVRQLLKKTKSSPGASNPG